MSLTAVLDPAVRLAHLAVALLVDLLPTALPTGARTLLAVVLVTWTVRALLFPLSLSAARSRVASLALADEVAAVRTRHAGDPIRAGREVRALYARAGVRPFAGILPLLVQLPVIGTVYRLVTAPVVAGHPNPVLAAVLFGVPLGGHWPQLLAVAGPFGAAGGCLAVLLVGLTVVAALSSGRMTSAARACAGRAPGGNASAARDSGRGRETVRGSADTPAAPVERVARMLRVMPFLTVGFAVLVPPAVGVYLLASTTWTLAEQTILARLT